MNHYWVTREVEADERQDFFCDLGPVRRVLPEEVGELRLQLAAPRLPRFQVRRAVHSKFCFQRVIARAANCIRAARSR